MLKGERERERERERECVCEREIIVKKLKRVRQRRIGKGLD